jgi:hypothetical protein
MDYLVSLNLVTHILARDRNEEREDCMKTGSEDGAMEPPTKECWEKQKLLL